MTIATGTLDLVPHYSIRRDTLWPRRATPVGGGAMQLRRNYARPLYQFTIHDSQADKTAASQLFGFASYFGGDIPFYWSGGDFGLMTVPVPFAKSDGVQTHFFLPNRSITSQGLVYLNGQQITTQPAWAMPTGLLIFPASPGVGELTATYGCHYKVCFWPNDETLLSEELFAASLFRHEGIVLREVVP